MNWWLWIIIGLAVLSLEMLIPLDFFLVFVGLAGIITGAISGIAQLCGFEIGSSAEYFICAVTIVLLFVFAKKPLVNHLMSSKKNIKSALENDYVSIEGNTINPNEFGTGNSRGTVWKVQNLGSTALEVGKSYKVSRKDGITLIIE
jgi:membrane protein implicated in regulation of membrane protease activity